MLAGSCQFRLNPRQERQKGTDVNTKINNTNPNLQPFSAINLAFENIELVANNRAAIVTRFTQTVTRNS
jgi:hypothetical protein